MKQSKSLVFNLKTLVLNSLFSVGKITKFNNPNNVILCYHNICDCGNRYCVNLNSFKSQIKKMSSMIDFVSLDELLVEPKSKLYRTRVAITFDDGFSGVMSAIPLLKKYKITPTIFLLSNTERASRKELDNNDKFLSTSQIKTLISQGWSIGCHSATHADFKSLTNDGMREEIMDSKRTLENKLGKKIKYFAFPRGAYNEIVVNYVKKSNYAAAFTIDPGSVGYQKSSYLQPRTIIDATHKLSDFPAVFSNTTHKLRSLSTNLRIWDIFLKV